MDHLGTVGVIRHFDGDRPVLLESQQGTGDLAVVGSGLQSVPRRQIERHRRNVDFIIRRGQIPGARGERGSQSDEGGKLK